MLIPLVGVPFYIWIWGKNQQQAQAFIEWGAYTRVHFFNDCEWNTELPEWGISQIISVNSGM